MLVECPHCGMRVQARAAGDKTLERCNYCQGEFVVPPATAAPVQPVTHVHVHAPKDPNQDLTQAAQGLVGCGCLIFIVGAALMILTSLCSGLLLVGV